MSTAQIRERPLHCACNRMRRWMVFPRLSVLDCCWHHVGNSDSTGRLGLLHTASVQLQALGSWW